MSYIALCVPYQEKDQAKRLGARWDPVGRTWEIDSDTLIDWGTGKIRAAYLPWISAYTEGTVIRLIEARQREAAQKQAEKEALAAKRLAWENDPPREQDPESLLRRMGLERFEPYGLTFGGEWYDDLYTEWFYNGDGRESRNVVTGLPFACEAERRMVLDALEHRWKGYGATDTSDEPAPTLTARRASGLSILRRLFTAA